MKISAGEIRVGMLLEYKNDLWQVLKTQHVKPGKGKAFVKTKLKNLTNGGQLEKTFRADEDVQQAFIDKQSFQFLYNDSDEYYFMNNESFDQISLNKSILNNQEILLKPNEEVTIALHENNPIDIILPTTVTLKVTHSEPAVKGDSVNSSTKEVTCETGFTLQVPMFINENELIKIDTKTQTYITRA